MCAPKHLEDLEGFGPLPLRLRRTLCPLPRARYVTSAMLIRHSFHTHEVPRFAARAHGHFPGERLRREFRVSLVTRDPSAFIT